MPDPATHDEYLKRFHQAEKIDGSGIGNVYVTVPCPFCAAPGWLRFEVLETEQAMQRDIKCKECGRSAKSIVDRRPEGVSFEVVQTGGDDPPSYLPPMRRV